MSETSSVSSDDKMVTTSTMMEEFLGVHSALQTVTYRPFLEELCEQTKFTKSELRFLYRGFKQECPRGVVQEDSFKEIYAKFFPNDSSTYAHLVFKAFDVSSCGTLTFKDMVLTLSTLLRGTNRDKLRWVFTRLYDINGNGYITKRDIFYVISAVHDLIGVPKQQMEDRKTREHVDTVFSKFDTNCDGIVTIDEFLDSCLQDDRMMKSLQAFSAPSLV